ncbi:MAG TPA: 16S rRNA processing protein RimM [Candidatus Merdenecus merdavium]|nr:16S rRNA processing protein RimM [Candidatus Merdenecus merdavium]
MEELLRVGVISSTHGLKGEVKVYPTTDDIHRFKHLREVILDTKKGRIDLEVENVRFFKNMVILKFKGFDHINDIEKCKGESLYVTRANALPLKPGQYFLVDLIGLTVYTDEDQVLGELVEVIETGANNVYAVKTPEGKEILIPAIPPCILETNIEEKKMKVHLLKGLVD